MSYSYNHGVAGYQDCICACTQINNFLCGAGAPQLVTYIFETMDWLETMD